MPGPVRVTLRMPPVDRRSGTTRYGLALADALEEAGVEVRRQVEPKLEVRLGRHWLGGGVSARLARWIPSRRADVVHATTPYCNPCRVADVVTVHDIMPITRPDLYGLGEAGVQGMREVVGRALEGHVLVQTECTRRDVLREFPGADRGRIHVVPLGVDATRFHPVGQAVMAPGATAGMAMGRAAGIPVGDTAGGAGNPWGVEAGRPTAEAADQAQGHGARGRQASRPGGAEGGAQASGPVGRRGRGPGDGAGVGRRVGPPSRSPFRSGFLNVLTVSSPERRKRLDLLAQAAAGLPFVHLVHVGATQPPPAHQPAAARDRAETDPLEAEGRFAALGPVSDERLRWLLSAADVAAHLSEAEGFGLPPLEALACGARVLASDIPPHREVLGEAARLVPLTVEAVQAALWEAWDGQAVRESAFPPLARRLERAAAFTWQRTAQGTLAVYRRVVAEAP